MKGAVTLIAAVVALAIPAAAGAASWPTIEPVSVENRAQGRQERGRGRRCHRPGQARRRVDVVI